MLSTEMELIKSSNARFEKNQLVISDKTTLKEWKDLGYYLSNIQGNVQFWIGDWARFGAKKGYYTNSQVYDQLEDITGLDRRTLQEYKTISDNVPSTVRTVDLSFSHHKEVAKLPQVKQIEFLAKACKDNLSVRELRLQIYKNGSDTRSENVSFYNNNSAFPIRLGEWHLKLQEEAFEMKTTIHMRVLCIIGEYFEKKYR